MFVVPVAVSRSERAVVPGNRIGVEEVVDIQPPRIKISPYDPERHVWVVDDSGQQIFKFTHDGKKLVMTLGEAGVRGTDEKHFGSPTDLGWLPDGTFFVARISFRCPAFSVTVW